MCVSRLLVYGLLWYTVLSIAVLDLLPRPGISL